MNASSSIPTKGLSDVPNSRAEPRKAAGSFPGKWSFNGLQGQYQLKPVDKSGTAYKALVKIQGEKESHRANLDLQELQPSDFNQLSPRSFKRTVDVTVRRSEKDEKKYTVVLVRKPPNAESSVTFATAEKVNISDCPVKSYDFFSLANSLDLAAAIRKGLTNEFVHKIVNEMVRRFQQPGIPHSTYIREMVALLAHLSPENRHNVMHKFVVEIENDPLDNPVIVEGLTEAFRTLVRSTYQKIIVLEPHEASESWDEFKKRPGETFSANQLLKIVQTLHQKLPAISKARTYYLEESDKVVYLEAMVAVIEMMVMAQVEGVERAPFHQPIYEALDGSDLDPDLRVAYLGCMGKQLWTKIPDDETKLHSFTRHAIHFGRFLSNLYKVYADKSLAPLADAFKELAETLKFQDGEEDWFKVIISLRNTVLGKHVNHLRGLKQLFDMADVAGIKGNGAKPEEKEAEKIVNGFQTHNPFFARALVLLLLEAIEYYVEDDPETARDAILLLQRICTDNFDLKDKKNEGLFHIHMGAYRTIKRFFKRDVPDIVDRGAVDARNKSYARQLKEEVFNSLKRIAFQHRAESIRHIAAAAARDIYAHDPATENPSVRLELPTPKPSSFPSDFFLEAVTAVCPWQIGLRELREKFYRDYQVKELRYHIDMQADSLPERALDVEKEMAKYTDPDAPDDGKGINTILLSGAAGSGKTLTAKKVIDRLWKTNVLTTYIPLQIQLATAKDPADALNELFDKHGLKPYLNLFKKGDLLRFFIWIDGIDETPVGMATNWPEVLGVNDWKNSKFMFGIRSDVMRDEDRTKPKFCYPNGETADHFRHLTLLPFDASRRLQFFEKFIAGFGSFFKIEWTPQKFADYLSSRPNLEKSASNPLLIRVTVITLPRIVEKNKKEGAAGKEIVDYEMMDAYFCYMVAREQHRQRFSHHGLIIKDPADYLNYALHAAKAIYEYSQSHNHTPWIPEEYANEHYPDLFNDNPLTAVKQRCSSLVFSNGCVGFYHSLYFDQFLQLLKNPFRRNELEKHLKSGSFEFESLFR